MLGNGETCTGDPARRAGNEFVFQGLAQQNVETFKEFKVKKVVSTCAHCFNTLKNEYKDFGVELEVVHHTQLLNRLVREGKLTPVKDGEGAHKRSITYHDPCYIGRHNGVYTPPRELLQVLPGAEFVEMERNSEKSFCCGAGGARMWMEENLGERINVNRTKEAVGTGADQIAVGCPFCRVMLSDGLTAQQAKGEAREEVEVLDVAQMLLASVKGEVATKAKPGAAPAAAPAAKKARGRGSPEDRGARRDRGHRHRDGRRRSGSEGQWRLVALRHPHRGAGDGCRGQVRGEEAEAAKPASSGGSLFDVGGDEPRPRPRAKPKSEPEPEKPAEKPASSGGSLFDIAAPEAEPVETPAADKEPEPEPEAKAEPEAAARRRRDAVHRDPRGRLALRHRGTGGRARRDPRSRQGPEPEPEADEPEPEPKAEAEPEPKPAAAAARRPPRSPRAVRSSTSPHRRSSPSRPPQPTRNPSRSPSRSQSPSRSRRADGRAEGRARRRRGNAVHRDPRGRFALRHRGTGAVEPVARPPGSRGQGRAGAGGRAGARADGAGARAESTPASPTRLP